jgi:hypothetical protein
MRTRHRRRRTLRHLQPAQHHHLRQRRCLYTPYRPGPHLQRTACPTHCARTTNATTLHAPNPPTATYPHRDAPQLTAGQHIQDRTPARTRTKHNCTGRPTPDRTGHAPEDQLCLAVNTTWRNTGITPSDIRRVFYRQPCLVCVLAKRNKDSKLIWSKRPPAQPPPPPLAHADHHQNRSLSGRHPTRPRGGHTLGYRRVHQLRQRWTHQPRKFRRV